MSSIGQYLKDTQMELRHVAWPTRTQTVVYTVLVAVLSIFVALYLGIFDFLFTTGLTRVIANLPDNAVTTRQVATSSPQATTTNGI